MFNAKMIYHHRENARARERGGARKRIVQ